MIYRHRDVYGKIFYVGCTSDKYRVTRKTLNRSKEWYEIGKYGFSGEIMINGLTKELAFELEEFIISEYGRKCDGGILVNHSIGGIFGGTGVIFSDETNQKHSINNSDGGNPRAKKVICTVTGKIWDCAKQCSIDNNLKITTLRNRLNGNHRTNCTTFRYLDE